MTAIFFDLDGVLAHFVAGCLKKHGREDVPISSVPWGLEAHLAIEPSAFWAPLDREFAASLEPYADGMALLKVAEGLVGAENIGILTSPWDTPGCWEGKKDWVRKHLPGYARRLFTGAAKHLFAGPTKILVDDRDENIAAFAKHSGYGLTTPRPWNEFKYQTTTPAGDFNVDVLTARLNAIYRLASKQ